MATEEKTKGIKKQKLLLAIVLIVTVILFVIRVAVEAFEQKVSVTDSYNEETNETIIYVDGEKVGKISGQVAIYGNATGKVHYITSTEDELFLLKGKNLILVEGMVEFVCFAKSSHEALLADAEGVIYLYDGAHLEKVTDKEITSGAISPDGRYFAYNADGDAYFGKTPGEEVKVEDAVISYISRNGKYVYAKEFIGEIVMGSYMGGRPYLTDHWIENRFNLLLVDKDGNKTVLAEKVGTIIGLNEDGSEIMYTTGEGTFVMVKGKTEKKVTDGMVTAIIYDEDSDMVTGGYYPIKSFKNTVCELKNHGNTVRCAIGNNYEAREEE